MSDFKLVAATKANGRIPVEKYRSARTGLTIIIAQVDGPVVNGYFCLATEAHDDDGLPHTLEHLIFLGSEDYPYKGVLDLLANRCLSSGTNAWTDTDHTCYTMTTAGSEGFLNLIPIYLDHILYPTLTDAGFTTEVHHVTGEGVDGGVVYCEMQGTENAGETRTHLEMLRAMYPGKCGYKSETGGIMKNLRESTSNKKVIDYHKSFYRPENLQLIITGRIDPQQVFSKLEGIQNKIISKGDLGEFRRAWQDPVPSLDGKRDVDVPYPADEEDNGIINIAWRGPEATKDLPGIYALMVLMEYLTETSVSPLQANFVEIDDPLASNVSYSFIENSASTVYLIFSNVPRTKFDAVEPQLSKVLNQLVTGEIPMDMDRMKTVILRRIHEQMSQIENSPHDSIAFMIIGDVLYGNTEEDFKMRLNSMDAYNQLQNETSSFWINLIKQYLVNNHRVLVKGIPSIQLEKDMKKAEMERIDAQKKSLGEDGLKDKDRELKEAMDQNDKEAPDHVLRSVDVPSAASIEFHPVASYTSGSTQQIPDFDLRKLPIYFQFDQVSSNFVYLFTVMNTKNLSADDKAYLPLILELLLESPVKEGDALVPHEEVVAQLAEDFLVSSAALGISGSRFVPGAFSESAVLYLQTRPDKYIKAVNWIQKILFDTKIVAERIKVIATKMENSISNLKRSGHKVVKILLNSLMFNEKSNINASSILKQQSFLKNLLKELEKDPEKIVNRLDAVRQSLVKFTNLTVHMAADMDLLRAQGDPLQPWLNLFPSPTSEKVSSPMVVKDFELTVETSVQDHVITALGSCESAFFNRCAPAINNAKDDDLPVLLLFLQYLTVCEGPMWRKIRGEGLAYGYSMFPSVSQGQLYLTLYRATHPVRAYEEAKKIATSYVDGTEEFDQTLLEAAKSSLIFELIEKEKTIEGVVMESIISSFKGVDREFNRELLRRIDVVTVEDLKRVGKKYIPPLFDGSSARTAIVCAPVNLKEVREGFKGLGVNTVETNLLCQ